LLNPLQRWMWRDPVRRAHILLRFAEVEADSGRDVARAAELTPDPKLRRLYLRHARDEQRHAELFRRRGSELLRAAGKRAEPGWRPDWLAPGERGLDDVRVEPGGDGPFLAFLHLSEATATHRFATYRKAVAKDEDTRSLFSLILKDEAFHSTYSRHELARVSPRHQAWLLWKARLMRAWHAYMRFAVAFAGAIAAVLLTLQYFILLPLFAWAAKRGAGREPDGWRSVASKAGDLKAQY
jgi:hypothetical protein